MSQITLTYIIGIP